MEVGMSVSEIYEQAASEIEARGKSTGCMQDERGRVCAIGALRIVVLGGVYKQGLVGPEIKAPLRLAFGKSLIQWNDTSDAATVIAGLRACAAVSRAQSPAKPVPILTYAGERCPALADALDGGATA